MKKTAASTLIKDLIIIAVLGGFAAFVIASDASMQAMGVLLWLAITGLPFGWRWASKIITAVSLKGIGIKMLISAFVGCIAIFVVVIKDVIAYLWEARSQAVAAQ